ncbi:hypothetical protein I79_005577 [Cricetulus griseus]|uniref:Uncharacterized protein n=1 Tax=Cricetulus griseus TaxID=10029 RepID=G3H5J5_CRIGR|nr:hypothetical protein I79_005577 [Cricetulus griseus]
MNALMIDAYGGNWREQISTRPSVDHFKWGQSLCAFGLYSILSVHQLLKREEESLW